MSSYVYYKHLNYRELWSNKFDNIYIIYFQGLLSEADMLVSNSLSALEARATNKESFELDACDLEVSFPLHFILAHCLGQVGRTAEEWNREGILADQWFHFQSLSHLTNATTTIWTMVSFWKWHHIACPEPSTTHDTWANT